MNASTVTATAGAGPVVRIGNIPKYGGRLSAFFGTEPRPPHVIRGAESAPTKAAPQNTVRWVEIGIDWVRMVAPAALFMSDEAAELINLETGEVPEAPPELLIRWAEHRLGTKAEGSKGRWLFDHAVTLGEGCSIHWGHAAGVVAFELTGSRLGTMPMLDRVNLLRELHDLGMHATRIDICADFRGFSHRLMYRVPKAEASGQLCRARVLSVAGIMSGGRNTHVTWYLGKRGKQGSGRMGRIYDKGSQTKTAPPGYWERYEVEFTKASAAHAAAMLAYGEPADTVAACRSLIFGAFDFKHENGRTKIDDRPRAAWWQRVMDSTVGTTFTEKRPSAEIGRYARHFALCYSRTLRLMASRTGLSIARVIEALSDDSLPTKPLVAGSAADQFIKWHNAEPGSRVLDAPMSGIIPI